MQCIEAASKGLEAAIEATKVHIVDALTYPNLFGTKGSVVVVVIVVVVLNKCNYSSKQGC